MKKMFPIYVLLVAILAVFVLQLRETRATREELSSIKREQLRRLSGQPPFAPWSGIPVFVTNERLQVENDR